MRTPKRDRLPDINLGPGPSPHDEPDEEQKPWELSRDGKRIMVGSEGDCWRYLHQIQSQSVEWACKYEGYALSRTSLPSQE